MKHPLEKTLPHANTVNSKIIAMFLLKIKMRQASHFIFYYKKVCTNQTKIKKKSYFGHWPLSTPYISKTVRATSNPLTYY
jgi:hypothetical protein